MKNLIKSVQFVRANRKADRTISMTFVTDLEQDSTQFAEIDSLLNGLGILYFKCSGDLTQQEIDQIDSADIEMEGKTKSQRLRNVMWRELEQKLNRKPTQEEAKEFYSKEMESLIELRKSRLDDR